MALLKPTLLPLLVCSICAISFANIPWDCAAPLLAWYHRASVTPRRSAAAKLSQRWFFSGRELQLVDDYTTKTFGVANWRVGDTGGGLRRWQLDLYWVDAEPLGPGKLRGRPS